MRYNYFDPNKEPMQFNLPTVAHSTLIDYVQKLETRAFTDEYPEQLEELYRQQTKYIAAYRGEEDTPIPENPFLTDEDEAGLYAINRFRSAETEEDQLLWQTIAGHIEYGNELTVQHVKSLILAEESVRTILRAHICMMEIELFDDDVAKNTLSQLSAKEPILVQYTERMYERLADSDSEDSPLTLGGLGLLMAQISEGQ